MCLVPDGDLFRAIRHGDASVVTDHIDTFTETGLKLTSGEELEADIIVTATGLNLLVFGGMEFAVDGEDVSVPDRMTYKGMMLEGVPNVAVALGYTNASWTLKCDLTCEYMCRLLNHMDEHGYSAVPPAPHDPSIEPQPFIDFNSGYVLRADRHVPQAGLEGAVAALPELRARHRDSEVRRARRRGDGVLGRRRRSPTTRPRRSRPEHRAAADRPGRVAADRSGGRLRSRARRGRRPRPWCSSRGRSRASTGSCRATS